MQVSDHFTFSGYLQSHVLSGPGLSLLSTPATSDEQDWDALVNGDGYSTQTGICSVHVNRLPRRARLDNGLWHLPQDEVNGWTRGDLDVLELFVMCDRDAGGRVQ